MERHYNMGELRKVVRESANEFKPVMGKNVPEDNKKINKEAYKDIESAIFQIAPERWNC